MPHNLSSLHRETSRRFGPNCALSYKRFGRYQGLSWTDYRRQADGAAAGLVASGVKPGDRVALLSENRHEWLVADIAILSAGAVNVPLHAPLTPPQAAYQVGHSEAGGIIVSNQAQADKIAAHVDQLPQLKYLISFEPIKAPPRLHVLTWERLKHTGWLEGNAVRDELLCRERAITGADLATIIYTSGTTGHPKGVMLTHENLVSNAGTTAEVCDVHPGDVQLSWLPYSHVYARTVDHYLTCVCGTTLALADSVDTLLTNLEETRPMWMTAVPRFYEKVWTLLETLSPADRPKRLRKIFGPRLRHLCSGGAPLPKHIGQSFAEYGVPIYEGYGLTESSPVISYNSISNNRLGTVGRAIPGVELKTATDGEVLTRGPHVMKGYWKDEAATAQTIAGGWLHTGDVGALDAEGFLSITDRKKDLLITAGGKNIAPTELERLLISDPYIDQAVVYGDRRPYVVGIIVPNFALLEDRFDACKWKQDVMDGFITSADVVDFYQQLVDHLMSAVSQPERVKKVLVLARAFQLANDELTATLKVRRRHIISVYEARLAALYEGDLPTGASCAP